MKFKIKQRCPKRFVIVLMVFIGYMNYFYLHINLSMAVVDMTSPKPIYHGDMAELKPEYNWDSKQIALILSSFSYGRLFGPIGGLFAGVLGSSLLCGISFFGTGLITLFTPFFLHVNFYLFIVMTALTGALESFNYASIPLLWARWLPPGERARCISISMNGIYAGSIASFIIAGWILHVWGWEMLFYVTGIYTILWSWIWYLVVKDDPSEDKFMSDNEREYIKEKLNNAYSHTEKLVYPWKDILSCIPFWAACLGKFCIGCGYTFTIMYLPQYIEDTTNIDIQKIGFVSTVPQLCAVLGMPLSGYLSEHIRSRKILSVTNAHKLYMGIATFTGATAFIVAGLWPNFIVCIICMSIFQFFSTFMVLNFQTVILDLAPKYSALMNGIGYFFYTVASIFTPMFVGFYVTSHSQLEWSICFITISVIFIGTGLIYLKFGSGKLQFWANYDPSMPQTTRYKDPAKYTANE